MKEPQHWPSDKSPDCCTWKAVHNDRDVDHGCATALVWADAVRVVGEHQPRREKEGGTGSAQGVLGKERDKAWQEAHGDEPQGDKLAAKTVVVAGHTIE